jgi:hypothetical protein
MDRDREAVCRKVFYNGLANAFCAARYKGRPQGLLQESPSCRFI